MSPGSAQASPIECGAIEDQPRNDPAYRRLLNSGVGWATLLTVITWPFSVGDLVPQAGLDPSWEGTLAAAASSHLQFGTQVVFTYGPLGFLGVPTMYYVGTASLAFSYQCAISASVFYLLIRMFRRCLPLPWAVLFSYVTGALVPFNRIGPEISLVLALIVLIDLLLRSVEENLPTRKWIVLGIMAGIFPLMQVSLSFGLTVIVAAAIFCDPQDRVRAALTITAAAMAAFLVGWFGTGNRFTNIEPFVRHVIPIVSGYSSAMSSSPSVANPEYIKWLVLVEVLLIAVFMVMLCRGRKVRLQLGVVISTVVIMWQLGKESFVRFDGGHWFIFFVPLPLIALATLSQRAKWQWVILGTGLAVAVSLAAAENIPLLTLRPLAAAQQFSLEFGTLSSSAKRSSILTSSRADMRKTYSIPPSMLAKVAGHTVDMSPWEQNVAWAYPKIVFDPLPIPQDYSAYTPSLDSLDAADLQTSRAPQFILQEPEVVSIDGRLSSFDPPTTQFETECRYREVEASAGWQLLKKGSNHCGRLEPVVTVHARASHYMRAPHVPASDDLIASFSLSLPLSWEIENLALKPPQICLSARIAGVSALRTYRFIVGTAADLHVLSPATSIHYSPPFTPPKIESLSLFACTQGEAFQVTTHFYRVHVSQSSSRSLAG